MLNNLCNVKTSKRSHTIYLSFVRMNGSVIKMFLWFFCYLMIIAMFVFPYCLPTKIIKTHRQTTDESN